MNNSELNNMMMSEKVTIVHEEWPKLVHYLFPLRSFNQLLLMIIISIFCGFIGYLIGGAHLMPFMILGSIIGMLPSLFFSLPAKLICRGNSARDILEESLRISNYNMISSSIHESRWRWGHFGWFHWEESIIHISQRDGTVLIAGPLIVLIWMKSRVLN